MNLLNQKDNMVIQYQKFISHQQQNLKVQPPLVIHIKDAQVILIFYEIILIRSFESGQRARAFVPEMKMINRTGEYDHNTNYRIDYHPHGLTLCAAKAYAIAQKKQKADVPIAAQ